MHLARNSGRAFEDEVAASFEVRGYEVERRNLNCGEEYDLLCRKEEMGTDTVIMVECKDWAKHVGATEINSFHQRAMRLLGQLRITNAIMISRSGFVRSGLTKKLESQAPRQAIRYLDYSEFVTQIVDFNYYLDHVIWDFESRGRKDRSKPEVEPIIHQYLHDYLHSRYIDLYVEKKRTSGTNEKIPVTDYLVNILCTTDHKFLLLGEIGSGKTSVCLYTNYLIAKQYRDPMIAGSKRIPLFLSLSGASEYSDVFAFFHERCLSLGIRFGSPAEVRRVLPCLPIALFLDGFDEMHPSNTPYSIQQMSDFLLPLFRLRIPILLTSRSHFFLTAAEAWRFLSEDNQSADDITVLELCPLSKDMVQNYLRNHRPRTWEADFDLMKELFDLVDLAKRPILLKMIVESLDDLHRNRTTDKHIRAAVGPTELYRTYTRHWRDRSFSRGVLSADLRNTLTLYLARALWVDSLESIEGSALLEQVLVYSKGRKIDTEHLAKLQYDVTNCSFLVRYGADRYAFAHKSFMEFFVAELMSSELDSGRFSILLEKRIDRAVSLFMRDMIASRHSDSFFRLMNSESSAARTTAQHLYRQLIRLQRLTPDHADIEKLRDLLLNETDSLAATETAVTLAYLGDFSSRDKYLKRLMAESPEDLEAVIRTNFIEYYDTTGLAVESIRERIQRPSRPYVRVCYFLALGYIGEIEDVTLLESLRLSDLSEFEHETITNAIQGIKNRNS